jgi:hypothetical protein
VRQVREENADRVLAIIEQPAATAGHKAGVSTEFFVTQMNYRELVPIMCELVNRGSCQGCGHSFVNERDIQIEHDFPPRHVQDWGDCMRETLYGFAARVTTPGAETI